MTWLGSRCAVVVALVLALGVAATSLGIGFVTDDQAFRAKLHSPRIDHWDLFRFQRGDPAENAEAIRIGRLAWWAAPDLKIHFFRPLTSELFAIDDAAFEDAAVGYHAMSLAWFAALLVGVAMLYRRLLPPVAATLAIAVFGLASANVEAYAWISARHILVGATGAAWALALYVRGGRIRWLGLAALVLGLAGSEAALGAIPIWCALAWHDKRRLDCLPPIAIGVAYLVMYAVLGAGTRASGGYHDPMADPMGFVGLAFVRVPILLGDAIAGIPAELAFFVSNTSLALVGVIAMAFLVVAWRATRTDRTLILLGLGGVLAVLPGVAGYPAGRVLVVPDLAFAAILGTILANGLVVSRVRQIPVVVLALAHFVVSPLIALHEINLLERRGRFVDNVARDVTRLVPFGGRAIVVTASDPLVFLYPRGILAKTAPGAVTCWSVLSAARSSHRLTRTADRQLVLEALDRPLLDGSFDTLFRADRPFSIGDTIDQCGGSIRVAAVDHGLPTRLEITYQRRLDDPKLAFLAWQDHQLVRVTLPAIGDSVDLH